jgi:hypothetical protein
VYKCEKVEIDEAEICLYNTPHESHMDSVSSCSDFSYDESVGHGSKATRVRNTFSKSKYYTRLNRMARRRKKHKKRGNKDIITIGSVGKNGLITSGAEIKSLSNYRLTSPEPSECKLPSMQTKTDSAMTEANNSAGVTGDLDKESPSYVLNDESNMDGNDVVTRTVNELETGTEIQETEFVQDWKWNPGHPNLLNQAETVCSEDASLAAGTGTCGEADSAVKHVFDDLFVTAGEPGVQRETQMIAQGCTFAGFNPNRTSHRGRDTGRYKLIANINKPIRYQQNDISGSEGNISEEIAEQSYDSSSSAGEGTSPNGVIGEPSLKRPDVSRESEPGNSSKQPVLDYSAPSAPQRPPRPNRLKKLLMKKFENENNANATNAIELKDLMTVPYEYLTSGKQLWSTSAKSDINTTALTSILPNDNDKAAVLELVKDMKTDNRRNFAKQNVGPSLRSQIMSSSKLK